MNKMKLTGIYQIRNLKDNRIYIGSTSWSFHARKNNHFNELNRNIHSNKKLQRSVNNNGINNFVFEILAFCPKGYCLKMEQWFLNSLTPYYNICKKAGSRIGVPHSQATKDKIGARAVGRFVTEETKNKVSQSLMGNSRRTGILHTDETKAKMSKKGKGRSSKRKGIPCSELTKERMRIAAKLKSPMSKEHSLNISKSLSGKKHTKLRILHSKVGQLKTAYIIELPNGKKIKWILGLQEFCKLNGLHTGSLMDTLRGYNHRGHSVIYTKGYKMIKKRPMLPAELDSARLQILAAA